MYAQNIKIAKECHREVGTNFSVQNQAWSLVPRIREADALVADRDDYQDVLETHPEVCFGTLNGSPLDHSKDRGGYQRAISAVIRGF